MFFKKNILHLFSNVVHAVPICGGLMLWKQHFTSYLWFNVNTKLVCALLKKCINSTSQQINNELRPHDFNKGVSITQKTNPKTHHIVRFEYFNRCWPSAAKRNESRLKPKNNIVCLKIVSDSVLNKLVQLNRITQGVLGADTLPLGKSSAKNS